MGRLGERWNLVITFDWRVLLTKDQRDWTELHFARSFQGHPTSPYLTRPNWRRKCVFGHVWANIWAQGKQCPKISQQFCLSIYVNKAKYWDCISCVAKFLQWSSKSVDGLLKCLKPLEPNCSTELWSEFGLTKNLRIILISGKIPISKKCDPIPLSSCKWFGFQCILYFDSDINDKSKFRTDCFLRYIPS